MDLRRIVQEVEARKHQELALVMPPKTKDTQSAGGGVAASILLSVRDRMLREDPRANVASLNEVIEPDRTVVRTDAPAAKMGAQFGTASTPLEAVKPPRTQADGPRGKDDFLPRYLLMSSEFERRYGLKGWTELVRKKCSAQLRR